MKICVALVLKENVSENLLEKIKYEDKIAFDSFEQCKYVINYTMIFSLYNFFNTINFKLIDIESFYVVNVEIYSDEKVPVN